MSSRRYKSAPLSHGSSSPAHELPQYQFVWRLPCCRVPCHSIILLLIRSQHVWLPVPLIQAHQSLLMPSTTLCMQMLMHVISFAFLVVIASTAMFVPILLYVLGLNNLGWTWQHAALFSAMIASTDAVAVSAILKKGTTELGKKWICAFTHSMAVLNKCMHCSQVFQTVALTFFLLWFDSPKHEGRGGSCTYLVDISVHG